MRIILEDEEVKKAIENWIAIKLDCKAVIIPGIGEDGTAYADVTLFEYMDSNDGQDD